MKLVVLSRALHRTWGSWAVYKKVAQGNMSSGQDFWQAKRTRIVYRDFRRGHQGIRA